MSLIPVELLQFLVGDIHQPLAVVGLLSQSRTSSFAFHHKFQGTKKGAEIY